MREFVGRQPSIDEGAGWFFPAVLAEWEIYSVR
jgi:hypothetical protein